MHKGMLKRRNRRGTAARGRAARAAGAPGKSASTHAGGFTLVEMLAVVAVIALVASLLAPVLGRAKETTRLALCKGRLRQLGLALLAYAGDNHTAVPVSEVLDNPHGEMLEAMQRGRYVGDPNYFYCPSQTDAGLRYTPENFAAGDIGYFYFSARRVSTNSDVSTFLRWSVPWPRELKTSMDGGMWVMSDIWLSGAPTAHYFYKKGVNYVTLRGNVHMITEGPRRAFR